jgi:hypothetical protein
VLRTMLFALCCAPVSASAASTARFAHSATLLTHGHVLVAGGVAASAAVLTSAEIHQTARDGSVIDAGAMNFARSSHTATILPDGRVLVTGGYGGGVTVRNTAELYNPITNSWSNVANNMSTSRYNHTATLMNDGRVLICGGQTDTAGTVTNSCDVFCTATSQTGCAGSAFQFVAAPANLQQARALHTAVLLKDGKVWFGGGWNPGATPRFLSTTERFDPALGIMNSAAPLAQGRAFHTATLMGQGKVLVAGGFNGDNSTINGASYGILRTAEIYDPVANSVVPAASMNARREMHTAVLTAENTVLLEGGLGNVTTTYITDAVDGELFVEGSFLNMAMLGSNALTTTTISGTSSATIASQFYLGTPIAGTIEDGEVWFSSPQIHIPGVAEVDFKPALESSPTIGLRASLNGRPVLCDAANVCGYVDTTLTFSGYAGQVLFADIPSAPNVRPAVTLTGGTVNFNTSSPLDCLGADSNCDTAGTITGGSLSATVTFELPVETVGGVISSATFRIITGLGSAVYTKVSSLTANITSGWGTFSGQTVALNALGDRGEVTVALTLNSLGGTVAAEEEATNVASGVTVTGADLNSLGGYLRYTVDRLDLGNKIFDVDIATVVIRRMVLSSPAYYDPSANEWSNVRPGRLLENVSPVSRGRFGATSTLLTNNDVLTIGGRECSDAVANCSAFRPKEFVGSGVRQDYVEYSGFKNWDTISSQLSSRRVFHTATNLPDGRILIAGGSNGPNVLRTAELLSVFSSSQSIAPTNAPMHDVRDLHTATLLPNGRVLIAGGFTTNANSTGSTSTSEIFYPDTGIFLRSGVMTSSRSNHGAALLPDGNVLVAGGFGANDIITATAEIFYSTAMQWRATTSMPVARTLNSFTTLKDGRVMLAGGINSGGVLSSVVAFNPATGLWSALAAMPSALHSHTASLLFDGRVLVAGGNDGLGEVDASYIYDPAADSWSATPLYGTSRLVQPRFGHNAVVVPNGDVVISGGSQRFGTLTEQIEYYHATDSIWISSGITFGSAVDQIRPRAYHTMTLGKDNRLYAIGGTDGVVGGQGTNFYTTIEAAFFSAEPDDRLPGGGASPRQAVISGTNAYPFLPNTLFTVTGSQFRGGTEASGGGAGSAHSSFSFPRLLLQQLEGSGGPASQSNSGFVVDLTTQIYANSGNLNTLNSSVTVQLPATNSGLPYGWYAARVGANDIYSEAVSVQVGPAKPSAAPTAVTGTPLGTSSMSWTWGAVAGVDGYAVYQTTTGVFISTTGTTSFVQTGLLPNTTASIRVAGYTLTGDGPLAQGATNFTLASTATSVSITSVTFSSLLLQWNPNGNEPGTIYEVTQSTDNFVGSFSTPVPNILNLTDTQTTITNLLSATTYYFRVRAYNGAAIPGGFSAIVSTLTRTSLASVVGSAASSTRIDWSWTNPGGVIEYRIYNATTGVQIATVPGAAAGFADTPLAVNSRRSILVSVVTNAGEGPLTPSTTHFTLANQPAQGNPHISAISNGSFTVNWGINSNPGYTGYRAVLKDVISGSTTPVIDQNLAGPAIAYTFSGLRPGTLYISSIAAVNGDGVESTWLTGSTYTLAQPARNLTVLNTTPVSILVSWDTQSNGPEVQWEVTYSTDQFVLNFATAVPFSSLFTGNVATITGLQTGTTYWIRVQGRTPFGSLTAFEPALPTLSTITFNGGAAAGSLAGQLLANSPSEIFGTLGNGREIQVLSPAGAFPSDVTMTISSFNVAGTLCPNGVNVAVSITNAPALQPLKPVFLNMTFGAGEIGAIPLNRLVLFRYEPVSGTCVPLETTASNGRVRAQINHFSLFQLGQVTLATDAGTARVFPNPFRPSSDSYLTIDRVPPNSRVRIFTLRGEQVGDVQVNSSGIATWAGTNGSGRAVASGLYLVMVESGSTKKILKVSLLR